MLAADAITVTAIAVFIMLAAIAVILIGAVVIAVVNSFRNHPSDHDDGQDDSEVVRAVRRDRW